jgi:hypothetical protein
MKFAVTALTMTLLATGCADFPPGTAGGDRAPARQQKMNDDVRERSVHFGNWRVGCTYEEVSFLTQCKAETYGKVVQYHGDEIYHPTPVLWVSWLKGEPKNNRSVCVFGHDYPVEGVSLQVDNNIPLQIGALNAAGCVIADTMLMKQLRAGDELNVTFLRWPWGRTKATFSLNRSINALDELDRLIAEQ